jgi:organic hydroperoxide reductase OsmC/OhrA
MAGMHPFPHQYRVKAQGTLEGSVPVWAEGLPEIDTIDTNAPPEFGGPEGYWSPETLLVAAVANCYVLSFRAIARASKLPWEAIDVGVEGVLERVDGVTRFTRFTVTPVLTLQAGSTASGLAETVLKKAKTSCLVTNSLNAECELQAMVRLASETRLAQA